jgi:hypothetical protein
MLKFVKLTRMETSTGRMVNTKNTSRKGPRKTTRLIARLRFAFFKLADFTLFFISYPPPN